MQVLGALAVILPWHVGAESGGELASAIASGKVNLDVRLRYEDVSQDNPLKDASALTLRTRLGYMTAEWKDLYLKAEFENVHALGAEDYNSGPGVFSATNGKTQYSMIPDPEGSEVNQAWLGYQGLPSTEVKLGRQRLILDNARFLGNVGWRQNEQTFDGVNLVNTGLDKTTIHYSYLKRSNFIFFNNFDMDSHLLNIGFAAADNLKLTGYAYLLDFDDNVAARRDTQTVGARIVGGLPVEGYQWLYTFEYASQSDYRDSPATVDADYSLAEVGISFPIVTAKLGRESLGGDGSYGFQTPLATAHAFQGWADMFLSTPATGVVDSYLSLGSAIPSLSARWQVVYHDFQADAGSAAYGEELDVLLGKTLAPNLVATIKYADYSADSFAVDTRRLWLQLGYSF